MKFKSTYPDGKVFNYTLLGSVTVSIGYNTTTVLQTTLTAADYDVITGEWTARWTIPKSATAGKNYNFTIAKDKILDFNQNSGPDAKLSSTVFEVMKAALTPTIVAQPATYYNRTGTATVKVQLSYPDLTFMAAGDLGAINVTLVTPFGNKIVKLTAADFTAPYWTINWKVPYNATVTTGYYFNLVAAQIKDAWDNAPTLDVASTTFSVTKVVLAVPAISTDKARYAMGEIVTGFFTPVYLDGSPVTKGNGTNWVQLTRADGTKQTLDATYSSTAGRWEVKFTVGYPVGIYTIKVLKNTIGDHDTTYNINSNKGPGADVSATLEVFEIVTLQDVLNRVNTLATQVTALQTSLTTVSGDISALKTSIATLNTAVTNLQTALTALSNTAAKQADLTAVNSAVSALSTSLSSLQSAISSLSSTAAAKADVQAVSQALDAAKAELDTVKSTLGSVSTSVSDNGSAISTINTYVLVAIILALVAAIGSILSIVLVYRKIAA
jgi:prefoldin subunit 5